MLNAIQQNSLIPSSSLSLRKESCLFFAVTRLFNNAINPVEDSAELNSQRKILKVAILGKPNAGKSTLINQILKTNVCDVSSKIHTTRFAVKTAFVSGNTQIIVIDTPGLVTKNEMSRYSLSNSFVQWKENVLQEVDTIGLIHEIPTTKQSFNIFNNLIETVNNFNNSKPIFLIFNKVDKLKSDALLLRLIKKFTNRYLSNDNENQETKPNFIEKLFFISALKNIGVTKIVEYLLEEAKSGDWILDENQICDTPLDILITSLLRAKILDLLPQEVPYICRYEIEYLDENSMGEFICVALIVCERLRHQKMLIQKSKKKLRIVCQEIESDLYNILKKVVRLRVVVSVKKSR